jgi:general secretion pathway protein G
MRTNTTRAGFTLLEILVVVMIIAILASIVGVSVLRRPGEARASAAKMQVKQLKHAVDLYRIDNSRPPTQQQGLQALVAKPTAEPVPRNFPAEGYLETRRLPLDPWNREYIYLTPGRQGELFEIITYGSDGEPGGDGEAADVSSSEF